MVAAPATGDEDSDSDVGAAVRDGEVRGRRAPGGVDGDMPAGHVPAVDSGVTVGAYGRAPGGPGACGAAAADSEHWQTARGGIAVPAAVEAGCVSGDGAEFGIAAEDEEDGEGESAGFKIAPFVKSPSYSCLDSLENTTCEVSHQGHHCHMNQVLTNWPFQRS